MAKSSTKKAQPANNSGARAPLWETAAMVAAFVLLWAWFGAHKSAQAAGESLGREWTAALLFALGAMALITVRRVRRFQSALEDSKRGHGNARSTPPLPWMPPDRNSHN